MDVILVHPDIPQNTGSIARTCAATKTPLHLIEPMGFEITEKAVRRAGLDYWPFVNLKIHPNWQSYVAQRGSGKVWLLSKFATRSVYEANFGPDDSLVFGSETKGLGAEFMGQFPSEQQLRIPMFEPGVRSLNLSNAVSLVLYEALRQLNNWTSSKASTPEPTITAQPSGSETIK